MRLHRCYGCASNFLLLTPGELNEAPFRKVSHAEVLLNVRQASDDLIGLNPEVLAAECELTSHVKREELRLRVLEH